MPYTYKSLWQYVLHEPADELLGPKVHLGVLVRSIVFIGKVHFVILDGLDPMVANGHLMGISPQIFDDTCGARERPLGIDHPRFFEQGVH